MSNFLFTSLFIFFSLSVFSQEKIENKLTEQHQAIKGTKVSLIPPNGFVTGVNFLGLQQTESGSSIMIMDIPAPYSEVSLGMTKENLLSKGVEVSKIDQLQLNGLPAMFVSGTQNANGNIYTKYILLFGTAKETILINGVFHENLKEVGKEVKKSMMSAYFEADKTINPFDVLDFSIDVTNTKLKFGKNISNSLVYSVDGQIPTKSADKTNLIITKSFSEVTIEDKKLYCINRLKLSPLEIVKIESTNEISMDGISGYELVALGKNKKTNAEETVYQVILFSDNMYYLFFGTTNFEVEKSIEDFKKAVKTFKRK
ncbi:MAG: hypothetical protein IT221_09725 [Fluviicola sp.]|nr:hypothetical protein [Fluviicola sp.]